MMIALAVHAFVTLTRTGCGMTRPLQHQQLSSVMSDSVFIISHDQGWLLSNFMWSVFIVEPRQVLS